MLKRGPAAAGSSGSSNNNNNAAAGKSALILSADGGDGGSVDSSYVRKPCRIPWRGALALLGGFLIQLTLGSFYSFGNLMTYMTSYMR